MGGLHRLNLSSKTIGLLAMTLATAIYLVLYFSFERSTRGSITAASLLPVLTAGAFFGIRVGLAAGGIGFLVNLILPAISGYMSMRTSIEMGSLLGGMALVVSGGVTGWLHEQRRNLRAELERRRMMENALRTSEERLLTITNHILDAVVYLDSQARVLYANPALYSILGYPPGYFIGRSVLEVLHPEDRTRALDELLQVFRDEKKFTLPSLSEFRCLRASGEYIWMETHSDLLIGDQGQEVQVILTARDVTNRKAQEKALLESNGMVRALLNSPSDMVLLIDPAGSILEINQAAARRIGLAPDELVGTNVFTYADPLNQKRRERAAEVLRTGQPVQVDERFNGQSFETSIYPITDPGGQVQQLAVFVRDITSYRNAEHAEREQRQLAQALASTAEVLSSTLDFDEVLNQILENIEKVVHYEAAEVMLLENDLVRVVRYQTRYGRPRVPELEQGVHLAALENLSLAAASHQPVLIPDTRSHPGWVVYPESTWINSYICAPIEVQGRVAGFLNIFSSVGGYFTELHAARLSSFAGQAAVALQNARLYSAAQRNAQQMALLNQITRSAIHASSRQEVQQHLLSSLGELFNTQGVYITQWDEENGRVLPVGANTAEDETYRTLTFPPDQPNLSAAVLAAGRVIAEDDAFASPHVSPIAQARMPEHSLMGIPLIADGRKLGAVMIGYRQPHHFTPEEIQLAELVGPQIALVVAKTELLELETNQRKKLARANALITSLGQVAARIETSANVDEILNAVGNEIKALGVHCLVAMGRQAEQKMGLRYVSIEPAGISNAEMNSGLTTSSFFLSPDNFQAYATLAEEHRPVFFAKIAQLAEYFTRFFPPGVGQMLIQATGVNLEHACVFLPMVVKEEIIGLLGLWGCSLREEDIPALSLFSSQLATALEKARLHAEVQRLSITDDLCGVFNRRGLLAFGAHEIERAQRFNRPLSILMLDIDLFKNVNDTFGHLTGDQVLRALADCCLTHVRDVDIVGRYGGDEFIILLIETGREQALLVAERLRQAASQVCFKDSLREPGLTISCGVTRLTPEIHNLDELIERADQALYQAKSGGRNQVYWLD